MKVLILILACLLYATYAYAFDTQRLSRTIKNKIKWTVAYKTPSEYRGIVYVLTDELLKNIPSKEGPKNEKTYWKNKPSLPDMEYCQVQFNHKAV